MFNGEFSIDFMKNVKFSLLPSDTLYIEAKGKLYPYVSYFKRWGFFYDNKTKTWKRSYFTPVRPIDDKDDQFNSMLRDIDKRRKEVIKKAIKNIELFEPVAFELRSYQKVGAALAIINGSFLIAYDMGLGKTITSLAAGFTYQEMMNKKDKGRILYVCPAQLRLNVYDEVVESAGRTAVIYPGNTRTPRGYKKTGSPLHCKEDVVILSYKGLVRLSKEIVMEKLFSNGDFGALIADEAHYTKNLRAQRTRAFLEAAVAARKYKKLVIFLTGTPILNRPSELYTIFSFLFPRAETWGSFMERYEGAYTTSYGMRRGKPRNLRELHLRLASKMHRKKKEEVIKELPPLTRVITKITGVKRPPKHYLDIGVNGIQKYKWELAVNKTDFTVEIMKEATPCLVFTDFRVPAKHLVTKALKEGINTGYIVGGMGDAKRHKMLKAFQQGILDALVIVMEAGGHGFNLQRASTVIFNDLPYNTAKLEQAESRAHRYGNLNGVVSVLVVAANDLFDNALLKYLQQKHVVVKKVTDGMTENIKLSKEEVEMAKIKFHEYFKKIREKENGDLIAQNT